MKSEKKELVLSRLLTYAGNYKYLTMLGIVLSAISSVTAILPVYYIWDVTRQVINIYPNFTESNSITRSAWLAVFWACATMIIYLVGLLLAHLAAFRIAKNFRRKALEHIMSLPLGFFTLNGSGKLRQLIDESASSTENYLAHNIPDLAGAVTAPVAIFSIMFIFDWRMGIISILPIIFSMCAMASMFMSKDMRGKMGEKQQVLEGMNNEAIEYVRGIPVVKTFGQTIFSFKRFHKAIMRYNDFAAEISVKGKKPMVGFEVLINSCAIFLAISGIVFISFESLLNEFLVMFLFGVFLMPLCTSVMYRIMFSSHNSMVSESALNRIDKVLMQEPLKNATNPKTPTSYDIKFENVTFSYPESKQKAVDNITLEVPQGMTYGLVGPSGGGKTTIATLIPRFFDTLEGSVKIGGIDVKDIDKKVLMESISFVFQHTSLYKMSILDNVRESKPEATEEEVLEALKAAQCMDFIDELPNGIHTVYGTKGTYLSGGQAQRIAIARAILKDAPIILLDEATSFTDPENEYEIKKAFDKLTEGKTVIMIAHRLSSIQDVDKICVVKEGKIIESGTHKELLDKKGFYEELWEEYQTAFEWNAERSEV